MIPKLRVMTVVGTRPEIIRLSRVIAALDDAPAVEHILVHSGQNYDYELNQIFFDDMAIRMPDYFLDAAGETASHTIGQILIKIDALLEKVKPQAFLVLGDTNSCLSAIMAKKRHIPIFHMEAGNRCFDQRVPEETNRKIVDHIADINLTYSDIAREYLLREGIPPDRVIKTGSPMNEVLSYYKQSIRASDVLQRLNLSSGRYFLISIHREENVVSKERLLSFVTILNDIYDCYRYPIIVSTHPRTRKMLDLMQVIDNGNIRFLKPMSFSDYNALQVDSFAVLSDSGTISEESSILDFHALNIRESHERPEAMEEASVVMVGFSRDRILQGLAQIESLNRDRRTFNKVKDYSIDNVSYKVVRIIMSYVDYVRRNVWSEI